MYRDETMLLFRNYIIRQDNLTLMLKPDEESSVWGWMGAYYPFTEYTYYLALVSEVKLERYIKLLPRGKKNLQNYTEYFKSYVKGLPLHLSKSKFDRLPAGHPSKTFYKYQQKHLYKNKVLTHTT